MNPSPSLIHDCGCSHASQNLCCMTVSMQVMLMILGQAICSSNH